MGTASTRRSGRHVDMFKAGIVDPVKVCYSAVCNAGSVAALILTTQTLIAKKPDDTRHGRTRARRRGRKTLVGAQAGAGHRRPLRPNRMRLPCPSHRGAVRCIIEAIQV
jgi:hypothetical protein